MWKFIWKVFTNGGWTTYWMKWQQNCTDRQIQQQQLTATTPTQKLIYTLPGMPHMTNRRGTSTRRNFTDDRRTTYWTKRQNTAPPVPTEKLLLEKPNATTQSRNLIYTLPAMPFVTNRHGNSTRNFKMTDGRPTERNNDEIPHRPTNSMETARH